MSDDLRTRIAAVLYQRYVRTLDVEYSCMEWMEWEDIPDKEPWLADADAVIRELGLTRRTGQGPYANHVWYQTDWTIE